MKGGTNLMNKTQTHSEKLNNVNFKNCYTDPIINLFEKEG